ncbi:MAG: phosphomannomutase/phosphoglucomutase [Candidatus Sericytochromatia bacterium]|nr:phosphomannomutase/phosphoglucomutase [Candidatus Sericytochromatia bacterium]
MTGIFKAYDIRGIYGKDLDEETAYKIGRSFVLYLKCKKVMVGQDTRLSTPSLVESLIRGITDQGADVLQIGLSTTDMFYFVENYTGCESGIMVTASHNPGEYNGFKLIREKAAPIGAGSGIEEIEKIFHDGNFPEPEKKGNIQKNDENLVKKFSEFVKARVEIDSIKPLRVVMDAGNGMAGYVAPVMFKDTNIEVIPLFFELDGSFPNHEANPLLEENRQELMAKVIETGADFGVGFDGDSDRCFFVDDHGKFVDGDFMTGLIGAYLIEKNPGATISFDVRSSRYTTDVIERAGGKALMWKVGHALMKPKMKEEKALFGGEVSGHFYFLFDDYYADNSYLPVFLVAEMISKKGKKLSELMADKANYFISGEINSTVKDADAVMKEIESKYLSKGKKVTIDGLSIIGDTWWFNIRKSNTEPLLRLNCEADSQKNMEALRDELLSIIRA